MTPSIILYAYPESPFGQKLTLVLLFKRLPYFLCPVPRIPPRDALATLGITYRRIPVLAIGNDVYLDTSLAVLALEKLEDGASLSGGRAWGVQSASAFFWADRTLFKLGGALLPWKNLSKEFLEDRSGYMGAEINPAAMEKARPNILSALRAHMQIIETQLATRTSPAHFVLDTPAPTYLDLALFFSLNWISTFGTADALFSSSSTSFPLVRAWLDLVRSATAAAKLDAPNGGKPPQVSQDEAARLIYAASPDAGAALADNEEPLLDGAGAGGVLKIGQEVFVVPDDTGKVPQKGKLVALNAEQVVIAVVGDGGRECRVHAPRLGFVVAPVRK